VGFTLGLKVTVPSGVGLSVGFCVGLREGTYVGLSDGDVDRHAVGLNVGFAEG